MFIQKGSLVNHSFFFFHLSFFPVSFIKFVFSKKATKIDEIFTIDLTVTTYCQIAGEDFVNFCGLFRKFKLLTVVFNGQNKLNG